MYNNNVQSVIFNRDLWNPIKSREWLRKHNFIYDGKLHTTYNYLRFRQFDPIRFKNYRTLDIGKGIKLIYGF